jgi:5-methylthioadenosine/S-adenosylhomocysteine deaminase
VTGTVVVTGARVYDVDGDVHQPRVQDIHVREGVITAVTEPGAMPVPPDAEHLDARGQLAMPGFVNAHHHSYDALARGLLEEMPFDVWALHSQPAYLGPRRREELRARTLLTALECLRGGITTVQDMCSLVPFDDDTLDVILDAYAEAGIRVVFSAAVRDVAALDIAQFLPPTTTDVAALVGGTAPPAKDQLDFVAAQLRRRPASGLMSWALSPSGPQRCTDALLEGISALSEAEGLPVFTHVYETKVQTARARELYRGTGGSMIRHLAELGLLTSRTNLVHAVWITDDELTQVAAAGSRIVHNPVSNMKLRSGVAPIAAARAAGVEIALGCDNCSCGDTQSMFQAMKGMCLLSAVSNPLPTGLVAAEAIRAATITGASSAHLADLGALKQGMRADLVLLELADLAYQPFNSAARQVVYAETGRGVRTVLVDGRAVIRDGVVTTVDEAALREEIAGLMTGFRQDFTAATARTEPAIGPLLQALSAVGSVDVGVNRLLDG